MVAPVPVSGDAVNAPSVEGKEEELERSGQPVRAGPVLFLWLVSRCLLHQVARLRFRSSRHFGLAPSGSQPARPL